MLRKQVGAVTVMTEFGVPIIRKGSEGTIFIGERRCVQYLLMPHACTNIRSKIMGKKPALI
jgi:hypothetical protein